MLCSINNDKIPAGIKIHFVENYVETFRSLGEMLDAPLTMICLSPIIECLASVKDKILLKTLRTAFEAMHASHIEINGPSKAEQAEQCVNDEDEEMEDGENAEAMEEMEDSDAGDAQDAEEDEGEDEDEEGLSEDENEDAFDFGMISQTLFMLGAEPEVKDANRKVLYALSGLFKDLETDDCNMDGGECCGTDGCEHDHGNDEDQDDGEEVDDASN